MDGVYVLAYIRLNDLVQSMHLTQIELALVHCSHTPYVGLVPRSRTMAYGTPVFLPIFVVLRT